MQLFVNDLTVIDFSYLCPKRGMVGESWIVDVVLDGGLDEQSMVLDFAKVKRTIKQTIDSIADHRLLVPMANNHCQISEQNDRIWLDFSSDKGDIHLACPAQAFALISTDVIDFDSVNHFLLAALKQTLPANVEGISLTLRAEILERPYYHYSHGLKKHDGNCQRIAHGHRSPVQIFVDGVNDTQQEALWAKRWQDIYLGSTEDCCEVAALGLSVLADKITDDSHYGFRYQAPQGDFQLAMPKGCCEIIGHDTTVELLAQYMAKTLSAELAKHVRVIAYEGVGKGAIFVAG
ncbi:6-carboxytetrahydropterin synthase [Shewanella sp. NIFS-20-20]|uniref:6-carboxytetrahydropterin synthase n=1 Tax=Shewanella sp. NIFS-20-20 TaxID=2853806 RepID=UPI001C439525|nr:6-carboxytetrahydropterin synthase [Shewanella sp. NIFS-20-20]MBV7317112.1 6-carboxytetrahydropterin synthase [Shewanella sp. NIFS-20-20]